MDRRDCVGGIGTAWRTTDETGLGRALQLVVRCAGAIGAHDLAGVCVVDDGEVTTYAECRSTVPLIAEVQQELGVGPVQQALRTSSGVLSTSDLRYAPYRGWQRDFSADIDVRAHVAFRLQVDGVVLGALNLYSFTPGAFGAQHVSRGLVLASHASAAVAAELELHRPIARELAYVVA